MTQRALEECIKGNASLIEAIAFRGVGVLPTDARISVVIRDGMIYMDITQPGKFIASWQFIDVAGWTDTTNEMRERMRVAEAKANGTTDS